MFMTWRYSWGHLFNDDPSVVSLVAAILPLVALFQVFDGISAVTGGIMRAQGKQFTGALINLRYVVLHIFFFPCIRIRHTADLDSYSAARTM